MTHFSDAIYQVILRGDLSGTVVHPFFVHFANLAGCHLYQQHRRSFSLLSIESIYLRLTLTQLQTMQENDDPNAYALANQLMATSCFCAYRVSSGLWYMRRATKTLKSHGIRFQLSQVAQMGVIAFVSVLYTEMLMQLLIGRSEGDFYDIELQFREQLPVGFRSAHPIPRLILRSPLPHS
jgi:hypothetical protein